MDASRGRQRWVRWALLASLMALPHATTTAQDNDDWDNTGDAQPSPSPKRRPRSSESRAAPSTTSCEPECRSGYACVQAECLPTCDRGCPEGTLCSEGGVCVKTRQKLQPASARQSAWTEDDPNQCYPDCRSGFTCIRGQCVSKCNPVCFDGEMCTDEGECVLRPDEKTEAKKKPDKFKDSIINLHMNALGGFQFGLTPTLELGKKMSGYVRVRPLNTGLLSYFLLDRDDDDFQWGLGAAGGMHIFSAGKGNMRGLFGGPALEYVFARTRDGRYDRATYGTHVLIPQFDLGYRWGLSRLLLGVGGRLGLSVPVGAWDKPIGERGCYFRDSCDEERNLYFVAELFLDIGVFL